MNSRIKYIQDPNNPDILVSKYEIVSARYGSRYKVFLNLKDMTFRIRNLEKRRNYDFDLKLTNLNVLKKAAKRELIRLGCSFKLEIRNRSFGLCEKGYTQQKHKQKTDNKSTNTIPSITKDSNLE